MAIFKPVNCTPYSNTFDISKEIPYYFECEIDCSNIQVGLRVNGYAITILDEENKQIFPIENIQPVNHISLIDDLKFLNIPSNGYYRLNTGLNGTYLKIPVIVNNKYIEDIDARVARRLGENWININNNKYTDLLIPGHSYKWIITLFQGVDTQTTYPKSMQAYDMILTQGEVLGSYKNRIQSYPSDNIFPDYYIQLYSNGKTIGNRVLIESYDRTLGIIYPSQGVFGFGEGVIGDGELTEGVADTFKIFKMTNNPDLLEVSRKVDYLFGYPHSSSGQSMLIWNFTTNNSAQYMTQYIKDFYGHASQTEALINFGFYDGNGQSGDILINTNSRIVFNHLPIFVPASEGASTSGEYDPSTGTNYSPFNGIYSPQFDYDEKTHILRIYWRRTSDANTWGLLAEKLIYVNNSALCGGQSTWQGQKYEYEDEDNPDTVVKENNDLYGIINTTFFGFEYEQPVELYDNIVTGTIFYNNYKGAVKTLYIKPYSGLEIGQMWVEYDNVKNPRYFIITDVNKEVWSVHYQSLKQGEYIAREEKISRGTRYQIKTWFRASDENFFTIYDEPVVKLEIIGEWKEGTVLNPRQYFPTTPPDGILQDKESRNDYEQGIFRPYLREGGAIKPYYYIPINQRNIRVVAKYQQNQFLPWKTFQWFLQDENDRIVSSSEVGYNGRIETVFYGLVENVSYTLVLQLEDQTNTIWVKKTKIQLGPSNIIFESKNKIEGIDSFEVAFDKQTASVSISAPSHGVVPQNDNDNVHGASEENNFYQSFGQEIISYVDKSTIAQALASLDGSHVRVSGKVISIDRSWSDATNSMTITISDATGSLQIVDLSNFVEINDTIRVKGTIYKPSISVTQMIQAEVDKLNGEELTPSIMFYSMRRDGGSSLLDDGYCLNIEFLADKEKEIDVDGNVTYNTEEIYYNSVFSSEISQEQQRPLTFDNHFVIKSKHILGTTGDNQAFQGEIFGFQIEFNDLGGYLDYSYAMQDPFIISNGEYIPNKNRGKLSLLQSERNLYKEDIDRDTNFYETNDYYYQNFNNSITYYNVDDFGVVVSEAQGVSKNYLCLSVWQPIDYIRYSYDLVNIIPISTPWIAGETDYGIIASSFVDENINPKKYIQQFYNPETGMLEKRDSIFTITNNTITLDGYWEYESMNSYKVGKNEIDIINRSFIKLVDYNTMDLNSIKLQIKWNNPSADGTGLFLTSEDSYIEINSDLSATMLIPVNKIGSLCLILPNRTTYKNLQISIEQIDSCRNILGPLNIYGENLYNFDSEPSEKDIANTPNLQIPITATNEENPQQSYGGFITSDKQDFICSNADEYVVYQHSPILWTDVRCKLAKVIEHQFQEEIVGKINSDAEGQYRLRNILMENSYWIWNDIYQTNTVNKSSWIWRDGDSIEDGLSVENQSILKLQKEMEVILPERQELINNELTFHTEGIFNAFDYVIPQYDINTIVYIKKRAQEE